MKLLGFRGYDWEADGYWFAITPGWMPTVSVEPNIINRAGTYATFGTGVVGQMSISGEFGYNGPLDAETAFTRLFKRLNPVNTTQGDLRAERNDGAEMTIKAVMQIPQYGTDNQENVRPMTFVMTRPFWQSPAFFTQELVLANDDRQSILFNIQGELETYANIRIKPTTQRTVKTANVGWEWYRRIRIANTGPFTVNNHPYAIDLGLTNGLVSGGKALASGNDLRILKNGVEIARTLTDWNSATFSTLAWIVIDGMPPNSFGEYEIIYGNASAGTPPVLVDGTTAPEFDIAAVGASRSTNAKWIYKPNVVGKGAWEIGDGLNEPTDVRYNTPAAWRNVNARVNSDDRRQEPYTFVEGSTTQYRAAFDAARARNGSISIPEENGSDGVSITLPVPILSVNWDAKWFNQRVAGATSDPVGRFQILSRQSSSLPFVSKYLNTTVNDPEVTLGPTLTTISPDTTKPNYSLAFTILPYNNNSIPASAQASRKASGRWYQTLELNLGTTLLTQTTVQAEMAVYELATELRTGGGGDAIPVPFYRALLLGNARGLSGTGTPRMFVQLNNWVDIDCQNQKAGVYDSTLTTLLRDIKLGAIRVVRGIRRVDGTFLESTAGEWLPLEPVINPLSNPGADTNVTGWGNTNVASTTVAAVDRDTSTFEKTPASFRRIVSANTAGTGDIATSMVSTAIPLGEKTSVALGIALRTSNINLAPTPTVQFFDAAGNLLSTAKQADDVIAAANTWYRRNFAANAPDGAVSYKVGVTIRSKTSNQTGTVWWDEVAPNDSELVIREVSQGSLTVNLKWQDRFSYG